MLCATCCIRVPPADFYEHWADLHMPSADGMRMYCVECHELITLSDEFQRHEGCFRTEAKRCSPLKCAICQYHAETRKLLARHAKMFHVQKRCGCCGVRLNFSWRMKGHILRCYKNRDKEKSTGILSMSKAVIDISDENPAQSSIDRKADSSVQRPDSTNNGSNNGCLVSSTEVEEVTSVPVMDVKLEQSSNDDDSATGSESEDALSPTCQTPNVGSTNDSVLQCEVASSPKVQNIQSTPQSVDQTKQSPPLPLSVSKNQSLSSIQQEQQTNESPISSTAVSFSFTPRPSPNMRFGCTLCGTTFRYKGTALRHLKSRHRVSVSIDEFIEEQFSTIEHLPCERSIGCQVSETFSKCSECERKGVVIKQLSLLLKRIASEATSMETG
ncbi:unnamed protein product [Soboliphyme baturini]|uniref:C2H2-type domain-containing protein n=1 Tax=Soboliphyme baturini TaxID=241478 RepID=A0A183J810_9BILA|nr:unnamed protein product [Soboliphyme baturini]